MNELITALIGSAVLLIPSFIGAALWFGSIRVELSHLQEKVNAMSEDYDDKFNAYLERLEAATDEIRAVSTHLSMSREEALRHFVPVEAFQRLEAKVDRLSEMVARQVH